MQFIEYFQSYGLLLGGVGHGLCVGRSKLLWHWEDVKQRGSGLRQAIKDPNAHSTVGINTTNAGGGSHELPILSSKSNVDFGLNSEI